MQLGKGAFDMDSKVDEENNRGASLSRCLESVQFIAHGLQPSMAIMTT